jgi:hexosaminidase
MLRFIFSKMSIFICFVALLVITSCSAPSPNPENTFVFLPSVSQANFNIENTSLKADQLKYAFSPTGDSLPLRYGLTKNITTTDERENAQIEFVIEPEENTASESYELELKKEKIYLKAQDKAGLFYGFITLNQLMEDAQNEKVSLPSVSIQDAPKIAFRPIQIDVKHHLEKKSYYYELLDELAQLKINGVIIEIEDKLQYKRRPEIASSDAYSIEEWKSISDYALARNIGISPLVQGLGHASFILKHDTYKHLRDDLQSDWAFNPLDPDTYKLQYDLYLDALEAFPHGKYLHVGGDEVQTTGRGSGKSALELNLIWLNKVTAFAAQNDRIPIFWDDMPLKQAGLMNPIYNSKMSVQTVDSIWSVNEPKLNRFIEQFPKNCVYMRWNYHLAESYGNGKAMDWFSSNGFNVMGATAGQTRWTLMPQRESNIDQIRIFAEQSINRNYKGLLLTLWDDDSPHFELYKRGIAAFSEFTWGGIKRTKEEFKKAYRHRKFGATFQSEEYAFIDLFDKPVELWTNLLVEEGIHRNSLNSSETPIEDPIIDLPEFDKKGEWIQKYSDRIAEMEKQDSTLKEAQKIIEILTIKEAKSDYNLSIYSEVANLVDYNFRLINALKEFDLAQTDEEEKPAVENVLAMLSEFEKLRAKFEKVYGKTRRLNKPENYILDQDHHRHPANQSLNFDWQFSAELRLLEKIEKHFNVQKNSSEGTTPRLK